MKQNNRQFILSMVMLGSLFFIFGLVSWVNSILVPYFKVACELNTVQSYLVTFAFYIAYLVMTIPSSFFLNKVGFKRGVEYGLWILAAGALLFWPAAATRSYNMFLLALFTMGTALAILQTAANPFVTIIGPRESAARRISIMGICNKFAGIVSPLLFAAAVIRPQDVATMDRVKYALFDTIQDKEAALNEMIQGVILPYVILAVVLFIFGFVFYKSAIPDIDPNKANASSGGLTQDRKSIFSYPYLVLGVLALFAHTGSQQISIATIISYAQSMGIDLETAKVFPSFTLGCIMCGYLLGVIFIPKYISQQKALVVCTVSGLILSCLVLFCTGTVTLFGMTADVSIWFLVLLGIPNSLIYAGIWPLAIKNLGKHTNLGSSLLVMALCGNAVMTLLYGACSGNETFADLHTAYWLLIPCFVYMIFYSVWGYKIEHWTKK